MFSDNNDYLRHQFEEKQMENRMRKAEEHDYDNYMTGLAINNFDLQEQERKKTQQRLAVQNLKAIEQQIVERESNMARGTRMNVNEADFNNRINFQRENEKPLGILGGGIPGIGMCHERQKQLRMMDRNLLRMEREELKFQNAQKAQAHPQTEVSQRQRHLLQNKSDIVGVSHHNYSSGGYGGFNPQNVNRSAIALNRPPPYDPSMFIRPKTPRNEKEFIKIKNGGWTSQMDIITNQMRF